MQAELFDNKVMPISKRFVLRSGFGIIIGLLVVSTVMVYRIQVTFSERTVEIHRRFMQEQEHLTSLRRVLWLAGITLRDHFLNPRPDSAALTAQIGALRDQAAASLAAIRRTPAGDEAVRALEQHFSELWAAVRTASNSAWGAEQRYGFLQQEIVARRDAAGRLLREIEKANQTSLADSEREFYETRTTATQRLNWLLAVCLVCGALTAVFAIRHAEHLEREAAARFAEVSDAKRELESLSARLMEVQEEERTRLSRELHDEIVQNLALIKMEIAQAQPAAAAGAPATRDGLARARALAESTVRTVRDISLLLRPSLLDDLGLGPALQWQAEEFTSRTGVPCEFEEILVSDDFSDAVKTCAYRVTQEALRNCEKHSKATWVSVRVTQTGCVLEVEIADNGSGFAHPEQRTVGQLGVLGMRERAAALGGTLSTGNRAVGGAVVVLTLPVELRSDGQMDAVAQDERLSGENGKDLNNHAAANTASRRS
jgi:signal transduction histidine kinase